MKMQLVLKRTFEAGHRLILHRGKCGNLHGHRYVARVIVEGDPNNKTGMIEDFQSLKDVIDSFDHAFIWNVDDPIFKLINKKYPEQKSVAMIGEPTAEHIADMICHMIANINEGFSFVRVELNETENGGVASEWRNKEQT